MAFEEIAEELSLPSSFTRPVSDLQMEAMLRCRLFKDDAYFKSKLDDNYKIVSLLKDTEYYKKIAPVKYCRFSLKVHWLISCILWAAYSSYLLCWRFE